MEYLQNFTFDELNIGDQASTERTLVEKDLILFAAVSGDVNPIHLDADYAAKTPMKQRIAHGIWSASLVSATLATLMPGPGTIYLNQSIKFSRPVMLGDQLKIVVEVTEKIIKTKRVTFKCLVTNQEGKTVLQGTAEVLAPTEKLRIPKPELPAIRIG